MLCNICNLNPLVWCEVCKWKLVGSLYESFFRLDTNLPQFTKFPLCSFVPMATCNCHPRKYERTSVDKDLHVGWVETKKWPKSWVFWLPFHVNLSHFIFWNSSQNLPSSCFIWFHQNFVSFISLEGVLSSPFISKIQGTKLRSLHGGSIRGPFALWRCQPGTLRTGRVMPGGDPRDGYLG